MALSPDQLLHPLGSSLARKLLQGRAEPCRVGEQQLGLGTEGSKHFLLFSWRKRGAAPPLAVPAGMGQLGATHSCGIPAGWAELSRGSWRGKEQQESLHRLLWSCSGPGFARNASLLEQGSGTGTAVLTLPVLPPSSHSWTFLGIHCRRHQDNADGWVLKCCCL